MFYYIIVVCATPILDINTCNVYMSYDPYITLEKCFEQLNFEMATKPEEVIAMGVCMATETENI